MGKIILRGILAGVVVCIVMMAVGYLCGTLFPDTQASYENYSLFRKMDDGRANLFWLYPIVIGIGLSWLWSKVKPTMEQGKSLMARAFSLSFLYLVVSILPSMIVNYASFQITKYHIISWTLSGLAGSIAGAIVIALMDKDKAANV